MHNKRKAIEQYSINITIKNRTALFISRLKFHYRMKIANKVCVIITMMIIEVSVAL